MEREQKKETNIELVALIEYVTRELKHSDFVLPEEKYPVLFCVDEYLACRDDYRSLIIQIWDRDDDDPLKKRAYEFMSGVLKSGCFDASIIFAMMYQRITPLTTKLLCENAEVIASHGVGRIICVTMQNLLKAGVYHDIFDDTKDPLSAKERELICEIEMSYSRFAD